MQRLRSTAQTRRANNRAAWQVIEAGELPRDERIPCRAARRDACQHQSFGADRRQILQTMNRDIRAIGNQRDLDRFGENAIAAHEAERGRLVAVAFGVDVNQTDAARPGERAEQRRNVMRLPERERARTCAEAKRRHGDMIGARR